MSTLLPGDAGIGAAGNAFGVERRAENESPGYLHPQYHVWVTISAMRGKLVEQDPQDPNDEPADKLLKSIQAEKSSLVKAGEIMVSAGFAVVFYSGSLPDVPGRLPKMRCSRQSA